MEQFNALFTSSLSTGNGMLRTALDYIIQRKGKQMRPMLVLLAAKSCGKVNLKCMHAACALELLHTASLVGDFLLSKALEHAVMTRSQRAVKVVAQLGQTLAQGELEQLDNLDSEEITEAAYYDIIRKKTASLFSACAELGALLSGGDKGDIARFMGLGTLAGICFQLRDDILDYIADDKDGKGALGKPVGQDMREGKLTLPVIHLALSHPELRDTILSIRKGRATDEQISDIVRMVVEGDGIVYAEKTMDDFCNMTQGLLEGIRVKEMVNPLKEYISFVAGRKW